MGAIASAPHEAPVVPAPVVLHVYDLGHSGEMRTVNAVLQTLGTGAFHCGVEIYGREWSFQASPRGSGVFVCQPRRCPSHSYRTSVDMGCTRFSEQQVLQTVQDMRVEWPGTCYDLLTRNCCHYSDQLCRRLGLGPIPLWTMNLAGAGAAVKGAYDVAVDALYPTLLTGCLGHTKAVRA
eukprot:CAMPEP_0198557484 /NCGR_PEP_ID=MMETSP1462-20131121/88713_1 /TAXON_ID=1333877 /ORGANISM="Brandtodinium nutriculum, Strain RCC3387" /LENGTH=178 /DNA_ID=CAMNT_0044288269 /DNA_START=52 /DNA_END=585 /DNA_ORIENTATION=-